MDLTIDPEPPHIKYAEAFKKSKEFEIKKVEIAEEYAKKMIEVYGFKSFNNKGK